MNGNINSVTGQTTRIRGLVQNLKGNGIKIPEDLTNEIKLLESLRIVKDKQQANRVSALNDLSQVSADDFEDQLAKAQDLWTGNDAGTEFISRVEEIQYRRILGALYNASGSLMGDISTKVNGIVEHYRLNEVSLPLNLATFDVMRASTEDLNAINAYRQAVPSLNLLWTSFKSIGSELGHDMSAREFSSALDVAFLLSDADTFDSARNLANQFEVLHLGVESMKNIQQLGLFGLVNMSGLNIEMSSISEAQYTRSQIQNPAAVVPEKSHRAAGFIL